MNRTMLQKTITTSIHIKKRHIDITNTKAEKNFFFDLSKILTSRIGVDEINKRVRALTVTAMPGPRQAGKTTLARKCEYDSTWVG